MRHEPQRVTAETRRWLAGFGLVLLALLVFRLFALSRNGTDLFFDEAQYWSWSLDPSAGYYSKPPLIAWIIRAATEACGVSEFCIRLPSPLIHTGTALIVFALARHLYDTRVGVLSGLAFATLPGVSLSAGIISTDVPLLFFWALALLAFARLLDTPAWWPSLLLGAALGLGLNAKYAMAYFVLCAGVYLAITPERRTILRDRRLWAALAIGLALIVPNLAWNYAHKFATFAHTADNARWGGSLFRPGKALEFFGAQFGVFGPILFAGLLTIAWRARTRRLPEPDRYLLAFALPVLVIITIQAFLSRAHANWAAVSYVAATVLVTATLVRELSWGWLRTSLGIHAAILVLLALGTTMAGRAALPGLPDPFARTLGWRALADTTRAELERARAAGTPYRAVIADDRPVTAELLYYMRAEPVPVYAWRERDLPQDHFELERPYVKGAPEPVLLVSVRGDAGPVTRHFASVERLGDRILPAGPAATRRMTIYALSGFKGR